MKFVSICLHLFMMFFSVPIFSYVPVNATENTTTSSPINREIRRNTWYNGDWCPIYIPEWWSPKVSRHPLDPYSFVHCQSGIIFFYLCGYPLLWYFGIRKDTYIIVNKGKNRYPGIKCLPLWVGFAIISIGSLIFEIVENEDGIIEKYRKNHGASSEYNGDSYQNIFGDIIMVQIGYMISWLFLYLNISWMSAVWFVVVDVCLILYMRDDGIFLFFNIFFKNKQIIEWQAEGVMMAKYQQMNNISLLNPPSAFL